MITGKVPAADHELSEQGGEGDAAKVSRNRVIAARYGCTGRNEWSARRSVDYIEINA